MVHDNTVRYRLKHSHRLPLNVVTTVVRRYTCHLYSDDGRHRLLAQWDVQDQVRCGYGGSYDTCVVPITQSTRDSSHGQGSGHCVAPLALGMQTMSWIQSPLRIFDDRLQSLSGKIVRSGKAATMAHQP